MKVTPLNSPWAEPDWSAQSTVDELRSHHAMERVFFEEDPTNPIPAFEVFRYLAAFYWGREEEPEAVSVPYWAIEALALGLDDRDSHTGLQSRW